MALNRITGLGMVVLGSSMLLALACDSGGTTAAPNNNGAGGGSSQTGTGGATSGNATGGAISGNTTGGAISGNSTGGKANVTTGGTSTANTSQSAACQSLTPPTGSGTLSITSGYVTAGTYKGYGFTWTGDKSIGDTCATPKCTNTGCTPAFGATALCGAGVVAADPDYNSIAGVGFNLNQANASPNPALTVAAGSTVTIGVTFSGTGTGNAAARIQLSVKEGDAEVPYCVDALSWSSGAPIDITSFNTKCWDPSTGVALAAGANVIAAHVVIPSNATEPANFALCITDFAM